MLSWSGEIRLVVMGQLQSDDASYDSIGRSLNDDIRSLRQWGKQPDAVERVVGGFSHFLLRNDMWRDPYLVVDLILQCRHVAVCHPLAYGNSLDGDIGIDDDGSLVGGAPVFFAGAAAIGGIVDGCVFGG